MTYLLEECDYLAMLEKLISDMVVCPDRCKQHYLPT